MRFNPLYGFLLRAALWLPPCFAGWYVGAAWFVWPANRLAGEVLQRVFPALIQATSINGALLTVTIPFHSAGQWAALELEVNSLISAYGLPLFLALSLSTAGGRRPLKLAFGALLLLIPQVWGICFTFLQNVAITGGPEIVAQAGFSGWQRDAVALGYQFGALIFPPLAPVVIWLALNRKFLGAIMLEGLLSRADGSPR